MPMLCNVVWRLPKASGDGRLPALTAMTAEVSCNSSCTCPQDRVHRTKYRARLPSTSSAFGPVGQAARKPPRLHRVSCQSLLARWLGGSHCWAVLLLGLGLLRSLTHSVDSAKGDKGRSMKRGFGNGPWHLHVKACRVGLTVYLAGRMGLGNFHRDLT
jgi:hypothetical protein